MEDKGLWRKRIREAGYTSPLEVELFLEISKCFIISCLNNCSHIFVSSTLYIFSYIFVYIQLFSGIKHIHCFYLS